MTLVEAWPKVTTEGHEEAVTGPKMSWLSESGSRKRRTHVKARTHVSSGLAHHINSCKL
jgi:hypothetical protein